MERPALKRLITDIRLGLIDAVVAYKIGTLARSAGLAQLTEHI